MTNFIRQSNNNMNGTYDTNHNQNHVNNEAMNGMNHRANGNKPSVTFQYNVNDFAKKANSLDSINAVERELDEVLKDLEMNSADLNEQLESEYNSHHPPNVVELPISIQKSGVRVESASSSSSSNSCSSPSMSLNKSNTSANSVKWSAQHNQPECATPTNFERMKRADFIKNCELFIDDSMRAQNGHPHGNNANTKKAFNQNGQTNGNNGRQNIISTYELCNECFDNTMLMSNQHEHHQHQGSHSKCFKNHGNGNNNNKPASNTNFRDVNNHSNCTISPLAYQDAGYGSHSTDAMSYGSNRPRLAQINESVAHESQSPLINGKQSSTLRKPTNDNNNKSSSHNGNVISQKVISIGMPTSRNGCESPSPSKHSEFKSELF